MDELKDIIGDYDRFLTDILDQVEIEGFDDNDLVQIDHLCYRTSSMDNYDEVRSLMSEYAILVAETLIADRPISVFRLKEPIYYDIWRIDTIEVPAPKPQTETDEGLEHVGYVIYDDINVFLDKYSGKTFDLKSVEHPIDPIARLQLNGCSIKFHTMSLAASARLERELSTGELAY